jgi:hypothetical protein
MTNLPREELLSRAEEVMRHFFEEGAQVEVHFKFTCQACGTRCTLSEPNILYENGECSFCGHVTPINEGGFTLHFRI